MKKIHSMKMRSGPVTLTELAGKVPSDIPTHKRMCTQWLLGMCEEATNNPSQCT